MSSFFACVNVEDVWLVQICGFNVIHLKGRWLGKGQQLLLGQGPFWWAWKLGVGWSKLFGYLHRGWNYDYQVLMWEANGTSVVVCHLHQHSKAYMFCNEHNNGKFMYKYIEYDELMRMQLLTYLIWLHSCGGHDAQGRTFGHGETIHGGNVKCK
jgi:hypothetical protein